MEAHRYMHAFERWVSTMDDAELEQLTIEELEGFKAAIETAIRSAIRAKQQAKVVRIAAPEPILEVNLELARDAWLKARKQVR